MNNKNMDFAQASKELLQITETFKENPDQIAEYLSFSAQFTQYSARNKLLIYHQNKYATFVAPFSRWKHEFDCSVNKGAKSIKILCPRTSETFLRDGSSIPICKATQQEKLKIAKQEIKVLQRMYFVYGSVFDIAQTNFPKQQYPEIYAVGTSSLPHEMLFDCLKQAAEEDGFTVQIKSIPSISLRGYYRPEESLIVLSDKLEDTSKSHIMAHEYAHAIMHSSVPKRADDIIAFEAEALSVLMHLHEGMELPDNSKATLHRHFAATKKHPDFSFTDCLMRIESAFHQVQENLQQVLAQNPHLQHQPSAELPSKQPSLDQAAPIHKLLKHSD